MFNFSQRVKSMAELRHANVVDGPFPATKDNGGNGNMDNHDFVTHKEFNQAMDKLENRFDRLDNHSTGIEHDISHMNHLLWWLMGIVSAGIIVPLLSLLFKVILQKQAILSRTSPHQ